MTEAIPNPVGIMIMEPMKAGSHLSLFREDIPPAMTRKAGRASAENMAQSRVAAAPWGMPKPTENPSIISADQPTASSQRTPARISSHPATIGFDVNRTLTS